MKYLFGTLLLIAISNTGFSHTESECHTALTENHLKAKSFASDIKSRNSKSKEQYLVLINITSKYISEAKKALINLKISTPKNTKKVSKPYQDAIKQYHFFATNHTKAIKIELNKLRYDEHKIKKHAKRISECINKAEQLHKELKKKRINTKLY